jgi:hypothetical protein
MDEIQYTTPKSIKMTFSIAGGLWFLIIGFLFIHEKMYKTVPIWGIIISFLPTFLFLASFYTLRVLISSENGIVVQQTWLGFQTYRRTFSLGAITKIVKKHIYDGESSSYEIQISYRHKKKNRKVSFSDRELGNIENVAKQISKYANIAYIDESNK